MADMIFGVATPPLTDVPFLDSVIASVIETDATRTQFSQLKHLSPELKSNFLGADKVKAREAAREFIEIYFSPQQESDEVEDEAEAVH